MHSLEEVSTYSGSDSKTKERIVMTAQCNLIGGEK